MKPAHFYPKVSLVLASVHDDGMHVEIHAGVLEAEPLPNGYRPVVATFRAEEEGEMRVSLDVAGENVEIPLDELERAIVFAREKVHPEAFYPYPDEPDGIE